MHTRHKRQTKRSKKWPMILLLILLIIGGLAAWWKFLYKEESTPSPSASKTSSNQQAAPDRIRLIASGDIVLHDSINENAKQTDGTYEYYHMMDKMKPVFDTADMRFCNQVTPAGGSELGITGYPKFNAPTEVIDDLAKLGCNVVNMASNHSFDHSQQAISANVNAWQKQDKILALAGQNKNQQEHDTVTVFEVKGVKIAFLAYTTYINGDAPATNAYGVNTYSRTFAAEQIADAKRQGAKIIITSMRWGDEYSQKINAAQEHEATFLAEQGVSVILGHGPHVLQSVDKIRATNGNETLVWYSLGNFLNTQLEPEALFNGLAVMDFDPATQKLTSFGFVPLYMHYEWSQADAKQENLLARRNPELYLLEDTNESLLRSQQSATTIDEQHNRIKSILNARIETSLLTKNDL